MQLELGTRPLSMAHSSRSWNSSSNNPTSSLASQSSTSAFLSRRRSSAAVPPPAPPPTQPIPHIPVLTPNPYEVYDGMPTSSSLNPSFEPHFLNTAIESQSNPYARPTASSNLAAVAAFSQRNVTIPPMSPPDSLSDSPPPSMLRSPTTRSPVRTRHIVPDRLLLSPTEPSSSERRPSSKSALTKALALARQAVQLDANNDDPEGALLAYSKSVALLSEVMDRVMRGEDTETSRRRGGRRRSVVAQEEEVRRLKNIHDTYADRMNILSVIYSLPLPGGPPPSYEDSATSVSTGSTQPPSPSSTSPSSDSDEPRSRTLSTTSHDSSSELRMSTETARPADDIDSMHAIGTAMFFDDSTSSAGPSPRTPVAPPVHPYASSASQSQAAPVPHVASVHRVSMTPPSVTPPRTLSYRPRASSILPPPPPPPTSLPPPAPIPAVLEPQQELPHLPRHLDPTVDVRQRGLSVSQSHKRTGSGSRLAALQEESERPEDHRVLTSAETYVSEVAEDTTARPRSRSAHRDPHRESHPLPPLPSAPGIENGGFSSRPNTAGSEPAPHVPLSPQSHQFIPRARGASVRSEISSIPSSQAPQQLSHQAQLPLPPQPLLINPSTTMGTIFQRRNKSSAPPSASGTSSPTESTSSRLTAVSLPGAGSATSLGRSRASSQPGRRPSTADRIVGSQHPFPPPLSAGINSHSGQGMGPAAGVGGSSSPTLGGIGGMPVGMPSNRKPSKLNPNAPPSIKVNTALVSPPLPSSSLMLVGNGMGGGFGGMGGNGATAVPLVPPPPIPHANIPNAPQSPLPPMAPPDPLRKPYHMMGLLRKTMTSRTGGYITRRLHVPQEVWSQGGAKLANVPEKIRVVEVLCSALEDIRSWSAENFGAGSLSSGMVLGVGAVGRKEGEAWAMKLEEFSSVCDGVVGNFGKKLGVGEGFVTKKQSGVGSWAGKMTRQFDKFTNGKNLDSPALYVQVLSKLFHQAQILDEHTEAMSSRSLLYTSFPADLRPALEYKLKHASEFFAKVVLTFVIRDLALLLDKYVKKCEKWLAE